MDVQLGAVVGHWAYADPDINAVAAAVSINARLFKTYPLIFLDR
jgi:hypothetical protein